ncbi:DUF6090 family protein [Flavobacteriaceae bacterium]|jgi:hypothetical protein|nr:DUF6090 family protein [Flavobacteriaceae bacterium]MDC3365967.1 DUF6090 family protein [Flavobacteriaceae bacterium]
MIRLFKKDKKKFINSRKIRNYLAYSIGEIILVVIGILIAVYINNWDLNQLKQDNGVKALKIVKRDLQTEKYVLEDFKKRYSYTRKYLIDILYNNKTDNLDSLKFHFGPYVHYKMNSEYISLKSSGKLNLISNSKLRSKLVNFYEVYYSIYKELEDEHKFFIDKRVNDYFFNQFPSDTSNFVDSEFVKSKLNDQTFKKILDQQITSLQYITENFYIEKIDELIKIITEELKNKQ